MGNESSTYENVDVQIPCVKYIEDDKGFRGEVTHASVKVGRYEGSSDDGPLKIIRDVQEKCEQQEARGRRNRPAITAARCSAPRFPKYSNALLRLESLEHSSNVSPAMRIALAKMGFAVMKDSVRPPLFMFRIGAPVTCFWCGFETYVTSMMLIPSLCSSLNHQCDYSNYIREYIDVPACIEENNGDLRLCGKTECPLCRWNIM